jgi:hypothetical protein
MRVAPYSRNHREVMSTGIKASLTPLTFLLCSHCESYIALAYPLVYRIHSQSTFETALRLTKYQSATNKEDKTKTTANTNHQTTSTKMNAEQEAHHCDYQDEDYEVEFNIDLEPHLSDVIPHPPSSTCRYADLEEDQRQAATGYADEDYEMEFQLNLEPTVMDLVPHNREEARDNLTISVAALALAGAMATARKLSRK